MSLQHGRRWQHFPGVNQSTTMGQPRVPNLLFNVNSTGLNDASQPHRQRIWVNGTSVIDSSTPRSYRITKLRQTNGTWGYVGTATYDVYGSTTQAAAMRDDLLTWQQGEMLVLSTQDEPNNNRNYFMDILRDDFNSQIYSFPREHRDSHTLISVKGVGRIYEDHKPTAQPIGCIYSGYLL